MSISNKQMTLIVIAIAAISLIGSAKFDWGLFQVTVSGCEVKSGLSVIPLVGYYKCESLGTVVDYVDIPEANWFNPGEKFTTCCDIFTTACEYTLQYKNGDTISSIGTIPGGHCVEAFKDSVMTGDRVLRRSYNPYTLYDYSPTGGRTRVYNTQYTCAVPYTKDLLLSACNSLFGGNCDTSAIASRGLSFDESTNYFDKWVFAPTEYNFFTHPDYGQVYCSGDGYLHSVASIELTSGCYIIPNMNDALPKQECCPGAISGEYICGDDFKWDLINEPDCSLFNPCPGSNYFVPDYSDSSRTTAIKYSCVDGKCVPTTVKSECTTDTACPYGYLCMLDSNTGIGKCVGSGTTPTTTRPGDDQITEWSPDYLIAGFLALLAFLVMSGKELQKRKRNWAAIAIGVMTAVGLFFVMTYLLENWEVILGGSVIALALGSLAIYFIPGLAAFILFVIWFLRKAFDTGRGR